MASLNKIQLIGNLGADAETITTDSNVVITNFSLATTRNYKGKDGNWNSDTTWHDIVGFGLSEYNLNQLKKGARFYVEGHISKRDYIDKKDIKRYVTEVVVERLIPLNKSEDAPNEPPTAPQGNEDDDLPF